MSDDLPRRRSPLWIMGCLVLVAWIGCGIYRRQVPPLTTASAILRVPSATDLGTLCLRPEVAQAAVDHLEAEGDIYLALDQRSGPPRLSGKLTVTKVKVAAPHQDAVSSVAPISTETWELTYRTPHAERALGELAALIAVLEPLVAPVVAKNLHGDRLDEQLHELETKHKTLTLELEKLAAESGTESADPIQVATLRDRVQTLQHALTEAQLNRQQAEEEWRLVEQEAGQQRLDALAAKLSVGPVQEAVLQIEKQRKLSAELTRLNDTERRLGMVYGDKHPQLVELRQKFDQTLSDLGGWDHVLDESHIAERLLTSLEQLLELKQQHETDLETQLELERQELAAYSDLANHRATLTAQLAQLNPELAAMRQATLAGGGGGSIAFAVQTAPEISPPHWLNSLGLLTTGATVLAISLGWIWHRMGSNRVYVEQNEPLEVPIMPNFIPVQEASLDLAQRRALRQARLQQVYAT